jgi:hypothetical protein
MAAIARVRISLRVFGDSLEPEEVSALLGRVPTREHNKGDKTHKAGTAQGNSDAVEPTGAWILDSGLSEKAEVEEHIESLLGSLSNDMDEWSRLTDVCSASIHCGLFLDQYNEGFELSPRVAQSLAERGLVVSFDIYSGDADA